MLSIKEVRKIIHEMVSLENGIYQLNDQSVGIRNVRLRKDRVIYDVVLSDYTLDKSSRQNNVETSLKEIMSEKNKTRLLYWHLQTERGEHESNNKNRKA